MAPPHSYIHVEDFESPSALVDYLDYLNQNNTAYLEYHAWRTEDPDWSVPTYAQPEEKMICGICQELKDRKDKGFPKRMIRFFFCCPFSKRVDSKLNIELIILTILYINIINQFAISESIK